MGWRRSVKGLCEKNSQVLGSAPMRLAVGFVWLMEAGLIWYGNPDPALDLKAEEKACTCKFSLQTCETSSTACSCFDDRLGQMLEGTQKCSYTGCKCVPLKSVKQNEKMAAILCESPVYCPLLSTCERTVFVSNQAIAEEICQASPGIHGDAVNACLLVYVMSLLQLTTLATWLVYEREERIREVLNAMGMKNSAYYASWFLSSTKTPTLCACIFTALLGWRNPVYNPWQLSRAWWLMIACCFASTGLSFLLSGICSNSSVAAGLSLLFLVLPSQAMSDPRLTHIYHYKLYLRWIPMLGLDCGLFPALHAETIWEVGNKDYPYSFMHFFGVLFGEGLLFTSLGLYLEQVLPRKSGSPAKTPFFFLRWFTDSIGGHLGGNRLNRDGPVNVELALLQGNREEDTARSARNLSDEGGEWDGSAETGVFEPIGARRECQIRRGEGVQVQSLRKVFDSDGAKKVAVTDLSFVMVPGEVFCLLGHNGAGKTTAISMIIGCLEPTQGNATIFGQPMWGPGGMVAQGSFKKLLGICTQFNMVYPSISLRDHVKLICRLKDVGTDSIDFMIEKFGLTSHTKMKAACLSGGTIRRMNLAMAFVGSSSRAVLLDEPTSGVDPQSRKQVWSAVGELKQDACVLLTTHYMDEAEEMADQVAIMARGQLQCSGSTFFLKTQYGTGYVLMFEVAGRPRRREEDNPIVDAVQRITLETPELVQPEPTLRLRLPFKCARHFPELFEHLLAERERLQILDFSISVTSLEDVFVNICSSERVQVHGSGSLDMPGDAGATLQGLNFSKGGEVTWWKQLKTMLHFRLSILRKRCGSVIARIVGPVVGWIVVRNMMIDVANEEAGTDGSGTSTGFTGRVVEISFMCVLLLHSIISLKSFDMENSKGFKVHQLTSGCNIYAWYLAEAIADGMQTSLSFLLLLFVRQAWENQPTRADGVADMSQLFVDGSFLGYLAVCFLLGPVIYVMCPCLTLKDRLDSPKQDRPGMSTFAVYWLYTMTVFAAMLSKATIFFLKGTHFALRCILVQLFLMLNPFLSLPMVLFGEPQMAVAGLASAFVILWILLASWDWMIMRSRSGKKCLEAIREFIGYVVFCGIPLCCSYCRGHVDPQDHDEIIMDESALEEAANSQEYKKLSVKHVTKTYKSVKWGCYTSRLRTTALRGVSFAMDDGVFGLLGVNGAGKSTLLKIIVGEDFPDRGEVTVAGALGYCCQEDTLYPRLSATAHILLYGRLRGLEDHRLEDEARRLLRRFGLFDSADQPSGHLSGGQKRRLMLCMALIGGPTTIILDEPSCGVDPVTRRLMWEKLKRIAVDNQVLLTTHSMEEAEAVCDRVAILDKGVVRCIGTASELTAQYGAGYWEVRMRLMPRAETISQTMTDLQAEDADMEVDDFLKRTDFEIVLQGDQGAAQRLLSPASAYPMLREAVMALREYFESGQDASENQSSFRKWLAKTFGGAGAETPKASGFKVHDLATALATEACGLAVQASCPYECALEDAVADSWRLRVRLEEPHCGKLFDWLERTMAERGDFEYTITPTTLDYVFQSIASQSEESI